MTIKRTVTLVLAGTALCGLIALATWSLHARPSGKPPQSMPGAKAIDLQALRARVARLEQARLEQASLRSALSESHHLDTTPSDVEPLAKTSEASEAAQRERTRRHLSPRERQERIDRIRTGLAEVIEFEGTDREWAAEVAEQMESTLYAPELRDVALLQSNCGTSVCGARLRFSADRATEEYERIQNRLLKSPPFSSSSWFVPLGEGEYEIYFSRPGEALPALGLEPPG